MDLADIQWLVQDEAERWLCEAADSAKPLHQLAEALRRELPADRVHLLLEQSELRERAKSKFPNSGQMFFTRLGLEQATDAWTAAYKAKRFAECRRIADLCCGIGGDLLALGAGGEAVGVDMSAETLILADANAQALGLGAVTLAVGEAERSPVEEFDAWHIDPDRRPEGKRTTRVAAHSPGVDAIEAMLGRNPNAGIKLSPASDVAPRWTRDCELEWISRGGQCRQLVVWSGRLARDAGQRRATAMALDGRLLSSLVGQPGPSAPIAGEIDEAIYEPDAAVFAAGLDGVLASRNGLARLTSGAGYLTGPRGVDDPLLAPFDVEEVLPFRRKTIAATLAARKIGRLEIKTRGVELNIDAFRKQLDLKGDGLATLIVTQREQKKIAILSRRVPRQPPPSGGGPGPAAKAKSS